MRHQWRSLLLLFCLSSAPGWADDESEGLEDWQRQILRALEAADELDPNDDGRRAYRGSGRRDLGAAEAAEKAERQHGGQALAAVRVGDRYRVRLLFDDGRVVTVDVTE